MDALRRLLGRSASRACTWERSGARSLTRYYLLPPLLGLATQPRQSRILRWRRQALLPYPVFPANPLIFHQPTFLPGKAFGQVQSTGACWVQLILFQGVELGQGMAILQRHQVQIRALAIQAGHQ